MKNVRLLFISLALCFFFESYTVSSEESVTGEILILENRSYPGKTLKLIREAKNNIRLCLSECEYLNRTNDIGSRLLEEVVLQAKRGIPVEIVLNPKEKNENAIKYILENGVQLYRSSTSHQTNANFLIIDDFTVIVGSIVWTRDSLTKNDELEFWIESRDFASIMTERFNEIKFYGSPVKG